ncbi:MAG: hypothetical protein WA082_00935 [Candidatus Moraniibacteriota bacterium]
MKRFPLTAIAAVAIATIATRPRFPDDMSSTKFLNIENDGDSAVAGGGQVATGDEIVQSGDPGVLAAAAMADPSAGQQQAEAGDAQQADAGVIEAKGMIVGDDSTAVGDPPGTGTEQVQQA